MNDIEAVEGDEKEGRVQGMTVQRWGLLILTEAVLR